MTSSAGILPAAVAIAAAAVAGYAPQPVARLAGRLTSVFTWQPGARGLRGPALVLALGLLFLVVPPRAYLDYRGIQPDRPAYEMGALSLAEGRGNVVTINHQEYPSPYAIGTPLFFSVLYRIAGTSSRSAIYPLCGVLGALALCVWFLGLRAQLGAGVALLAIALALTSRSQEYLRATYSELPTLLASATLFWMMRAIAARRGFGIVCAIVAGGIVGFAALLRVTNLAMLLPLAVAIANGDLEPGERLKRLVACVLPAAAIFSTMLVSNLTDFGAPLRAGYHYWDSYWFDYHLVDWRYAVFGGGREQVHFSHLAKYAIDLLGLRTGPSPRSFEVLGSPFDALLLFAGLAGACQPGERWRAARQVATQLALLGGSLLLFYSMYAWRYDRFLIPAWPWAVAVAAFGAVRLAADSRPWVSRLAVGLSAGALVLGAAQKVSDPLWPVPVALAVDSPGAAPSLLAWLRANTERNALFLNAMSGFEVEIDLIRGSDRLSVPFTNSQVLCPRKPSGGEVPREIPAYQEWALQHGCMLLAVRTVEGSLAWLVSEVSQGRAAYVEAGTSEADPANLATLDRLRTRFVLLPFDTGERGAVYRLALRHPDGDGEVPSPRIPPEHR